MESYEELPTYNIETSLEKVGFTDIQKVELNEQYLAWAKENLEPEVFTALKENYESLDVHKYKYLSDGLAIAGYLWTPKNMHHSLPLTIWNRGGTGEYGSIGERVGTPYTSFACELAKLNSVVIGSEYRGGVDSEGHDEHGGTDLNDVVTLKALADSLPFVATKQALVAGVSRGGMMSYQLATKADWVKGVISLSGTTDLISSAEEDPGMKNVYLKSFGGSKDEMKKRSAVHFYNEIPKDLPILVLHGTKDERVSVEQVRTLHTLLKESDHTVEYHEFPEGNHGFYGQSSPYRDEVKSIIEHFIQKTESLK
jgi:dipeptidyl aminopeptidase/acylaminoacyl peptidase